MLDKTVLTLIAEELETFAEWVSMQVCEDSSIPDTPENRELIRGWNKWSNEDELDPVEYHGGLFITESSFTRYLAHLVREEINELQIDKTV